MSRSRTGNEIGASTSTSTENSPGDPHADVEPPLGGSHSAAPVSLASFDTEAKLKFVTWEPNIPTAGPTVLEAQWRNRLTQPDCIDAVRRALVGETSMRELHIGGLTWEARVFPTRSDSEITGAALIAVEVTNERRVEAALASQIERQGVLAGLGRQMLEETNADDVIQSVLDSLQRELGASFATFVELGQDAEHLVVTAWAGCDPEDFVLSSTPNCTLPGYTLANNTETVVSDMVTERRFATSGMHRNGILSAISVPVGNENLLRGALTVGSPHRHHFEAPAVEFVKNVAVVLAATLNRQEDQARLRELAVTDTVTGLPNRSLLVERLSAALALAKRTERQIAVLFIDLDHFKWVNDWFGHLAGDELLRVAAQRIVSSVRSSDLVARFGGDEFVVVSEMDASENFVLDIATRLEQALSVPVQLGDHEVTISASVGIAVSDDTISAEDLLGHADAALYRAKELGRHRHEVFDHSLLERAASYVRMTTGLRRALRARDELVVHYQPVVSMQDERVVGAEALVRWRLSGGDLLFPSAFIPHAEESGLILPLTTRVLREAAQRAAAWFHDREHPALSVAVNISPSVLVWSGLADEVATTLQQTGLDPRLLTLEITESGLVRDPVQAAASLEALRGLGVSIAIDDFGTGYSSLGALRDLNLDCIKIDRSFVSGTTPGLKDPKLVEAALHVAVALGLRTVAEGVETAEQANTLRELGCDDGQGFLWSQSLNPDDMATLARTRLIARQFQDID